MTQEKQQQIDQDRSLTELPENWIKPDPEDVLCFDKQVKVRYSSMGYMAWTVVQKANPDNDTPELAKWTQISDFYLTCTSLERYVDSDKDRTQRLIRITGANDISFDTTINAEEMNTEPNFVKWLESKGNYTWWGTPQQLRVVKHMLFPLGMEETSLKNIAGYDPERKLWIVANGIVKDGKIHKADDNNLILVPGRPNRTYRLLRGDMEQSIAGLPWLNWDSKDNWRTLLREVLDDLATLWGQQTELAVGWFFACMFRSRFFLDTNHFPLLFLSAPKGQGKTHFLRFMMQMFGLMDHNPKSLSNLTQTSIYTVANVFRNIPVWLDEYKEDLVRNNGWIREALKNNYDGSSRTVGTLDAFKTKSRMMRTGLVISGEMRADDPALDSRCINVTLTSRVDNALYKRTKAKCAKLQSVVVEIMTKYDDYWPLVRDKTQVLIRSMQEGHQQARAPENYAMICAVLDILAPDADRLTRVAEWLGTSVQLNKDSNAMSEMLADLPYLVHTKKIKIPFLVERSKAQLNVQAQIFKRAYHDLRRDVPRLRSDELVRLGQDAGIMSTVHAGKAVNPVNASTNVSDPETGEYKRRQNRCFVFDLNNSRVMEVADQLDPPKVK